MNYLRAIPPEIHGKILQYALRNEDFYEVRIGQRETIILRGTINEIIDYVIDKLGLSSYLYMAAGRISGIPSWEIKLEESTRIIRDAIIKYNGCNTGYLEIKKVEISSAKELLASKNYKIIFDIKIINMRTNIIVIDNFYTNVQGTRDFILSTDFRVKGNFPGARTKSYATESLKKYFEQIIGKKINFEIRPDTYNGAFQYTTKEMKSWIHRDMTDWGGVLYLTPNAPLDAGTAFFKHKATGLEEVSSSTPVEIKKQMDSDGSDMSKWEMVDYVGNKYNRLILFRGTRSHRSMEYFGDSKHTGRLFQLFFFNEIKPQATSVPKTIAPPIKKPKVAVLFFTTSRYEYLVPMLESFNEKVKFGDIETYKIMVDDYPLRRDIDILNQLKDKYKIDKLVLNETNQGYSLAWKTGWSHVPKDIDYIWHQEEDFTFNKEVEIKDMIETLEKCPTKLTQVVLKRQKWYDNGDFVDSIESGKLGEELEFDGKKVVIHQTYFNSNPCLYPRWILDEEYSQNPQETVIVYHLKKKYPDRYSAIYGGRKDEAYIKHIGIYNQGKKVLENEPGWSYLKDYDPDKKYYSKSYMKEFR